MKIIDRYVTWNFFKNYVVSFMVLIGMYVVLDMVFNFDDLADLKGRGDAAAAASVLSTIGNIADYYFYQAFLFFVHLSGVIPVVGAAFTLMRLSRFNELTAMLAAGVPLLRIAMPIILAGVVLNALMIVDQELIIPAMLPKLTRSHDDVHRTDVKWFPIQAMQDADRSLIYVTKYTPPTGKNPATMEMVDVIERGQDTPAEGDLPPASHKPIEAKAHITADRAVWNETEQRWDLQMWDKHKDAYVPGGTRVSGLEPSSPESKKEPIEFYKSNVTPEEVALYRSGDWVEMLPTSRIDQLIARPGSYGQMPLLRVKHFRFTTPIMNVVLLLLAIPTVLTREPGTLKSAATKCLFLTGLGMGSVFLSHQLAGNPPAGISWANNWPVLMAWMPILVFAPIAVFLLDRVKT